MDRRTRTPNLLITNQLLAVTSCGSKGWPGREASDVRAGEVTTAMQARPLQDPLAACPLGAQAGTQMRLGAAPCGFLAGIVRLFGVFANVANVDVAGSNPVSCSRFSVTPSRSCRGGVPAWPCLAACDLPSADAADSRVGTRR
jgi:hypothetical protein